MELGEDIRTPCLMPFTRCPIRHFSLDIYGKSPYLISVLSEAASPSGKAGACKALISGSNPDAASIQRLRQGKSVRYTGRTDFVDVTRDIRAEMAELVDARDLKSLGPLAHAGSIPALGIF